MGENTFRRDMDFLENEAMGVQDIIFVDDTGAKGSHTPKAWVEVTEIDT